MSMWVTGAILISAAAVTTVSVHQGNDQQKAIKNAQNDAVQSNDKAIKEAKEARDIAGSQAQAQIDNKKRTMAASNTVFTNPMGIGDQAATAKKSLLGL